MWRIYQRLDSIKYLEFILKIGQLKEIQREKRNGGVKIKVIDKSKIGFDKITGMFERKGNIRLKVGVK